MRVQARNKNNKQLLIGSGQNTKKLNYPAKLFMTVTLWDDLLFLTLGLGFKL